MSSDGQEIDQVQQVIDDLKNNPTSRRIIWDGWNVAELDQMALPPCHKHYQFYVNQSTGQLSGAMVQRSADAFLGLGFNIANLALVTHLLARQCGYLPGESHLLSLKSTRRYNPFLITVLNIWIF